MFHSKGPTFGELARQALSSTERGYDLLAPKFDYTPFRTPDPILQTAIEQVLDGPPIDRMLDVCCGTGAVMHAIAPHVRELLVGLDMSRGMLRVAREHLDEASPQVPYQLVRGDALQMPFAARFDLATCFGALGHILPPDEPQFVRQLAAVLRPGGRFLCVTIDRPRWWSPHALLARSFNAAMHIRNLLVSPPFIMFYLTFLVPRARTLLEQEGFRVEVRRGVFSGRYRRLCVLIATRP